MVKILVPTDYSKCSLGALKHAACLAREANGSLLVLHVVLPQSASLMRENEGESNVMRHDIGLLLQSLVASSPPGSSVVVTQYASLRGEVKRFDLARPADRHSPRVRSCRCSRSVDSVN